MRHKGHFSYGYGQETQVSPPVDIEGRLPAGVTSATAGVVFLLLAAGAYYFFVKGK